MFTTRFIWVHVTAKPYGTNSNGTKIIVVSLQVYGDGYRRCTVQYQPCILSNFLLLLANTITGRKLPVNPK